MSCLIRGILASLVCGLTAACVARPPRESPSPSQLAVIERTAISVVAADGSQGTGTLLGSDWLLFVRHRVTNDLAENMDGLGVDVRGTIVMQESGDLNEDGWFSPSLGSRLELAAHDWRLLRLRTPATRRPAAEMLPPSSTVRTGDRVVIGGFVPRSTGPTVGVSRISEPRLWCSLGIVTSVAPSGAFAVVLTDESHEPGCSGGPVLRLDADGEPEAVVGIYTGDYKGPALPRLIQSFAACAPVTPGVERRIRGSTSGASRESP